MMNWFIFSLTVLCFSMCMLKRHVLNMLLILEMIMVLVLSALLLFVSVGGMSSLVLLLFLFVSICEGCLGIGLLVGLIRGIGGDWVGLMSLL